MYKANFCLRTAIRIPETYQTVCSENADEVYEQIKAIHWEDYLDIDKTFAVDAVVFSEEFRHSKFVSYKVKDAIGLFPGCIRQTPVRRRISKPDVLLNIHCRNQMHSFLFDSSGESRTARFIVGSRKAPLNGVWQPAGINERCWRKCDLMRPDVRLRNNPIKLQQ